MPDSILSILAPVFVFGLVVFVHELGHFWAAKLFGVYAPRFSIGFGPSLFKWRRGETEYKVGILPLGGYVRMASKMDEESAFLEGGNEENAQLPKGYDPEAMIPHGPKPIPENRWFESKPYYARMVILLAGVVMNILLGWMVNIGLAAMFGNPSLSTAVGDVQPSRPAAIAGIQKGDSIATVNGVAMVSWDTLVNTVGRSTGEELSLGIIRDGQLLNIAVTPQVDTFVDAATNDTVFAGKIGVLPGRFFTERVPFGTAVQMGTVATAKMAGMVFDALKGLVTREVGVDELGGPIAIAQASVQAADQGGEVLFFLIALISVNLAVFNLLPIPILDGGQIVMQTIEAVRGKPLSERARENVAKVGLLFILLLFLTVTFNDIKRVIGF